MPGDLVIAYGRTHWADTYTAIGGTLLAADAARCVIVQRATGTTTTIGFSTGTSNYLWLNAIAVIPATPERTDLDGELRTEPWDIGALIASMQLSGPAIRQLLLFLPPA